MAAALVELPAFGFGWMQIVALNWADWVIVVIVAISCLLGLRRGLIREALSVANWLVALLIAVNFRDPMASLLEPYITTGSLREVTAFGLLFGVTLLVGGLVNYLIGELVRVTGLNVTDRVLGMGFGLVRGFVIIMAVVLLVPPLVSIDQDRWWAQSTLIPHFLVFEGWARVFAQDIAAWVVNLFSSSN